MRQSLCFMVVLYFFANDERNSTTVFSHLKREVSIFRKNFLSHLFDGFAVNIKVIYNVSVLVNNILTVQDKKLNARFKMSDNNKILTFIWYK